MEASDAFCDVSMANPVASTFGHRMTHLLGRPHDMIESAEVELSGRSVRIRSAYEYKSAIHARRASIDVLVPLLVSVRWSRYDLLGRTSIGPLLGF
jgi:hypothetical protein